MKKVNNKSIQNGYSAFFICGMSRGGTTWLGKCLNEHPSCAVYGESLYWGRHFINPKFDEIYDAKCVSVVLDLLSKHSTAYFGDGAGNLKFINNKNWRELLFSVDQSSSSPGALFLKINELISRTEGKRFVIEKTPHHVNWIGRIVHFIPNAQFIIMVRGGYSFMLSYKHQGDRKAPSIQKQFRDIYHPLGCALVWRRYIKSSMNAYQQYGERCILIPFEDLEKKPNECWLKILKFIGISYCDMPNLGDKNSSFISSRSENSLKADDLFWMNLVAGGMMKRYGYDIICTPFDPLLVLKSFLKIVPWAFRVLIRMRSAVRGSLFRYFFN